VVDPGSDSHHSPKNPRNNAESVRGESKSDPQHPNRPSNVRK
jgi:hypothetical protein